MVWQHEAQTEMVLVAFPKPTSFEEVQLVKLEQLLIHQILVRQTHGVQSHGGVFFQKKSGFHFCCFWKGLDAINYIDRILHYVSDYKPVTNY